MNKRVILSYYKKMVYTVISARKLNN